MTKKKNKQNRNADRIKLRDYLSRYDALVKEKDRLTDQQRTVGQAIGKVEEGGGAREAIDRFAQLTEQAKQEAAEMVCEITATISLLPLGSIKRRILELRYISRFSWQKTCKVIHMEISRACEIERAALDELLQIPEVKAKIV